MSRGEAPKSRSLAAVPPVETISTPCFARPAASSSSPVLSESEISARRTGTRSVIDGPLSLAGAPERPADFAAQCRYFADNDKLACAMRLTAVVDPQALLDGEVAAAAAEVPRRRAARAKDL